MSAQRSSPIKKKEGMKIEDIIGISIRIDTDAENNKASIVVSCIYFHVILSNPGRHTIILV